MRALERHLGSDPRRKVITRAHADSGSRRVLLAAANRPAITRFIGRRALRRPGSPVEAGIAGRVAASSYRSGLTGDSVLVVAVESIGVVERRARHLEVGSAHVRTVHVVNPLIRGDAGARVVAI
jgi:hypothetical protein